MSGQTIWRLEALQGLVVWMTWRNDSGLQNTFWKCLGHGGINGPYKQTLPILAKVTPLRYFLVANSTRNHNSAGIEAQVGGSMFESPLFCHMLCRPRFRLISLPIFCGPAISGESKGKSHTLMTVVSIAEICSNVVSGYKVDAPSRVEVKVWNRARESDSKTPSQNFLIWTSWTPKLGFVRDV